MIPVLAALSETMVMPFSASPVHSLFPRCCAIDTALFVAAGPPSYKHRIFSEAPRAEAMQLLRTTPHGDVRCLSGHFAQYGGRIAVSGQPTAYAMDDMISHTKDVSEFLEWVREARDHFRFKEWKEDPFTPWFRGQPASEPLWPKLYRSECGDSRRRQKLRDVEDELREEFIVRAPPLSEGVSLPNDDWGWYFLMQHFGAPTRLLDWTDVALVALYFAIKDSQGMTDRAVWALDPYELNYTVTGDESIIPPNAAGVGANDMKRVKRWLPERFKNVRLPRQPIAVYPTHLARRIGTQRSGFTIHGSDPMGLDKIAKTKRLRILVRTTIPASKTEAIRGN
jgi:hypothetical protein